MRKVASAITTALAVERLRRTVTANDVLLASFPKSGNTWFRFIWANLIRLGTEGSGGEPVDFHRLHRDFHVEFDSGQSSWTEQAFLPRLLKTHRPYSKRHFEGIPAVYIRREPEDVFVSYFEYLAAKGDIERTDEALKHLIRDRRRGVEHWCRHVTSWRNRATVALDYEDMLRNPEENVLRSLHSLGCGHVAEPIVEEAVDASSFDVVARLEEDKGRPSKWTFSDGFRFARAGTAGEGKQRLDDADREYIARMKRQYGIAGPGPGD